MARLSDNVRYTESAQQGFSEVGLLVPLRPLGPSSLCTIATTVHIPWAGLVVSPDNIAALGAGLRFLKKVQIKNSSFHLRH